jgi:predicted Fe-Mo cluster-binding NifX family protein
MTREQELDFLRSQAEMIRGQLEQIDARMRELEKEE